MELSSTSNSQLSTVPDIIVCNQNKSQLRDTEEVAIKKLTRKEATHIHGTRSVENDMFDRGIAYSLATCDDDGNNEYENSVVFSSPSTDGGSDEGSTKQQFFGDAPEKLDLYMEEVKAEHSYNEDECENTFNRYYGKRFLLMIRICCAISVLSVCMNTPRTFVQQPFLRYVTILIDVVVAVVLCIEMVLKMRFKGVFYNNHKYFRSAGRLFELFMVACVIISIILQLCEITSALDKKVSHYLIVSFIRVPRPLLLLRSINVEVPSNVAYGSMRKVGDIILYMIYFLLVFALIGGQLFGVMDYFCVNESVDNNTIYSYNNFTIPIKRCPPTAGRNLTSMDNFCPLGYICKKIPFDGWRQHTEYFDNIFESFITIYEAMSLEGWSFKMYETMDIFPVPLGIFVGFTYFFLVLLIIGLLGRNVFIAVITDAFDELRVMLSAVSTVRRKETVHTHVLRKIDKEIKLVHIEEAIITNKYRRTIIRFISSRPFIYFIHAAVFLDAIIQGFLCNKKIIYNPFQIFFTILFDLEAALKIVGMGVRPYFSSSTGQFQAVACIGSTILLPLVINKHKEWAMFQVLRLFRLISLWSSLQLFLRKILGSTKIICQFLLFTLTVIIIAGGIFMQLFCGFDPNEDSFSFANFPRAFKAAFQVFMQEAWTEVMEDLLVVSGDGLAVLVYFSIISFHLMAATVLVSVFIALILDNLEMQEELKIVKQRRLGHEIVGSSKELPLRIRIFKWFNASPKVIAVKHVEYVVPKIRESFVNNYLGSAGNMLEPIFTYSPKCKSKNTRERYQRHKLMQNYQHDSSDSCSSPPPTARKDIIRKKSSITAFMKEAGLKRLNTLHHSSSDASVSSSAPSTSSNSSLYRRGKGNSLYRGKGKSVYNSPSSPTLSNDSKFPSLTSPKGRTSQRDVAPTSKLADISTKRARESDVGAVIQKMEEAQIRTDFQIEDLRENHPKFDESLFIFSSSGTLRTFIQKVVHARYKTIDLDDKGVQLGAFSIDRLKRYGGTQTYLEWIMLGTTWISLLAMIAEFSEHRTLFDETYLFTIEIMFITTSTLELLLRIIADGFLLGSEPMMRDFGDVLHLTIYIVSLIYTVWQPRIIERFSGAYVLLVLRCLRPIRLITLCLPLRKEVWKVVRGYKDLFKVFVLLFLLMFVFASYGVQTFSGRLKKCNDENKTTPEHCVGFFEIELAKPDLIKDLPGDMKILVPRMWRNPRNFDLDTMQSALLTLLEMLSLEGWTEIRDTLEDIEKVGSPWGMVYTHLYVLLACLIGLTLVIGVIVSNYNVSKGTALLTVEQKRWKDLKRKLELEQPYRLPPKPLGHPRRCRLYDSFLGPFYLKCYSVIVFLNSTFLFFGQLHYGEFGYHLTLALDIIAFICCIIFVFDTFVKIYTFSFQGYFMSRGNMCDFVLMILGLVYMCWSIPTCHESKNDPNIHEGNDENCHRSRSFGTAIFILRFMTLSFKHSALRMLMLTIIMGVIKSFFTLGVLVVILITYGFLGIIFFGSVKRASNLNAKVNFESFENAIFLLIRIATGEDWNSIMHDAMIAEPYCRTPAGKSYWNSNCGNRPLALLYFHSYNWLITYILLNVLIGVVIDNFSTFYLSANDPIMSEQDIQIFQGGWNVVDIDRTGFVTVRKARFCLRLIYERLKLDKPLMLDRMFLEIEKNQVIKNKITFHNLLFIIAYKKIADMSKSLQLEERLAREEIDKNVMEEVAMVTIRSWASKIIKRRRQSQLGNLGRRNLEKRFSGISNSSFVSTDDLDLDSDDDLLALDSFASYLSSKRPSITLGEPDRSPTLRRRSSSNINTGDKSKRMSSEIYYWWEDELENNEDDISSTIL